MEGTTAWEETTTGLPQLGRKPRGTTTGLLSNVNYGFVATSTHPTFVGTGVLVAYLLGDI